MIKNIILFYLESTNKGLKQVGPTPYANIEFGQKPGIVATANTQIFAISAAFVSRS